MSGSLCLLMSAVTLSSVQVDNGGTWPFEIVGLCRALDCVL